MKFINNVDHKYGIMQPYFLPYIGYFSLINKTDQWIVFDDTQYKKQSWGNRNRILKHPEGLSWIKIPLKKHQRKALYSEIEIQNERPWKEKLVRQFEFYRINAPHYERIIQLFKEIIEPKFEYLVDLNIHSMVKVCEYLKIPFNYVKYSDLNLDIKDVKCSGDWALQICKKLKINSYINPYMGHFMFQRKDWEEAKIELQFLLNKNIPYSQKRDFFEERLSIIDVLMWNSVEEVHELLASDLFDVNSLPKSDDQNIFEDSKITDFK